MTPWQKVHQKFGVSAAHLAKMIGRDRSKISRHLRDPDGLISGRDQRLLLAAAREWKIELKPEDLVGSDGL